MNDKSQEVSLIIKSLIPTGLTEEMQKKYDELVATGPTELVKETAIPGLYELRPRQFHIAKTVDGQQAVIGIMDTSIQVQNGYAMLLPAQGELSTTLKLRAGAPITSGPINLIFDVVANNNPMIGFKDTTEPVAYLALYPSTYIKITHSEEYIDVTKQAEVQTAKGDIDVDIPLIPAEEVN